MDMQKTSQKLVILDRCTEQVKQVDSLLECFTKKSQVDNFLDRYAADVT